MGPWFPGDWPEQELGWTIWTEAAEGQGYAFEAVTALRRHVYGARLATAVSYIDPANTRSRALAQRLGCTFDTTPPPTATTRSRSGATPPGEVA
jgi:RimJ/RimL family protein N-acetyltransferase